MTEEKTIFQKIIDDEIPSYKIYEDDKCLVILDKFPESKGKCLAISKEVVDYVFDLEHETYTHMFEITRKVVKAIDKSLEPQRTCVVVEGFEVPHSHIKIIPVYNGVLNISGGKEIDDEEAKEISQKIQENL